MQERVLFVLLVAAAVDGLVPCMHLHSSVRHRVSSLCLPLCSKGNARALHSSCLHAALTVTQVASSEPTPCREPAQEVARPTPGPGAGPAGVSKPAPASPPLLKATGRRYESRARLEDAEAVGEGGVAHVDLAVEATRPQQRLVQH